MLHIADAISPRKRRDSSELTTGNSASQTSVSISPAFSLSACISVCIQLAIVLGILRLFQLEADTGLSKVFPLLFGGFMIHAWLPMAYRLPFFVGLSFAAVFVLFGGISGLWLIGIGMSLIGACHLPIARWMRIMLILTMAALLAAFRANWIPAPWSPAVLAMIGSIFMFRLALYLYDMDHLKVKPSPWQRIAYFFMLPNIVFPFFPIVDYIHFQRSYYNTDPITIYQKGVLWMLRGAIHLILYRIVYLYFTPAIEDIQGLGGVLLFIVSAYLLYLRISGLFHLIIGMLCLFGFNLPETHKHYFLASSFNDYWRRINIYWKDFMMKLFFYPVYMKTRHWGSTRALVFSTLVVFACTWLLHSYQVFWLHGSFPIRAIDGIYWGVLGVLVAINSVWETRRAPKKRLTKQWQWVPTLGQTLRIVATFVFLSVMWSFWSSESVGQWWLVMQRAGTGSLVSWGWLAAGLGALYVGVVAKEWLASREIHVFFDEGKLGFREVSLRTGVMALVVLALGMPQVQGWLGEKPAAALASLKQNQLNDRDREREERGYYESLLNTSIHTAHTLWGMQRGAPPHWKPIMETDLVEPGADLMVYQLKPNLDATFKDASFTTNRWGMRDRDYTPARAPGTLRIALLGASYEQGAGVANHETFEAILEDSLNVVLDDSPYGRIEILNFATGGYSPLQNAALVSEKVKAFQPDIVVYAVYSTEERRMLMQLEHIIKQRRSLPYAYLNDVIAKAGATHDMSKSAIRARLQPYSLDLLQWSFNHMAEDIHAMRARPIALLIPTTRENNTVDPAWESMISPAMEQAGFDVVLLNGVYGAYTEEDIALAPWDQHLNTLGHRLVAAGLLDTMLQQPDLFLEKRGM